MVAGRSSQVAAMAGQCACRSRGHVLQAFVTEGLKGPCIDHVVTYGDGPFLHQPVPTRAGLVFGGDLDFLRLLRRALEGVTFWNLPRVAEQCWSRRRMTLMPDDRGKARMLSERQLGAGSDGHVVPDGLADHRTRRISTGLYLNCGW